VDDSEDDVELISRAFRKVRLDARVQTVRTGADAIRYLENEPPFDDRDAFPKPNLIVLDLKMPGIDGYEVLNRIRGRPESERTPVVIFTSIEGTASVNRTFNLGATVYFVKPSGVRTFEGVAREIKAFWQAYVGGAGNSDLFAHP
jgi:CheY-like chemotaxis protein